MHHIRTAQIVLVGIMTPALTGLPQAAAARSVDIEAQITTDSLGVSSRDPAIRALQEGVFALTPAEKLTIGGGRIRVAEGAIRSKTQRPRTQSPTDTKTRRPHKGVFSICCHRTFHTSPGPTRPLSLSVCPNCG